MTHKILNRDAKDEILKAFRLFDDDETGTYSPDARVIGIKDTDPEEEQLFVLLHEAGHAKIHRDKRKLSRLAEEEVAWMEGRHLAQTLKININQRSWASFCEKHLDDYRKWALTS